MVQAVRVTFSTTLDFVVPGSSEHFIISLVIMSFYSQLLRKQISKAFDTIYTLNYCPFDISCSDLIIHGLVTNGTAKICCHGLILALFYSTMVIKNYFG